MKQGSKHFTQLCACCWMADIIRNCKDGNVKQRSRIWGALTDTRIIKEEVKNQSGEAWSFGFLDVCQPSWGQWDPRTWCRVCLCPATVHCHTAIFSRLRHRTTCLQPKVQSQTGRKLFGGPNIRKWGHWEQEEHHLGKQTLPFPTRIPQT